MYVRFYVKRSSSLSLIYSRMRMIFQQNRLLKCDEQYNLFSESKVCVELQFPRGFLYEHGTTVYSKNDIHSQLEISRERLIRNSFLKTIIYSSNKIVLSLMSMCSITEYGLFPLFSQSSSLFCVRSILIGMLLYTSLMRIHTLSSILRSFALYSLVGDTSTNKKISYSISILYNGTFQNTLGLKINHKQMK